MTDEELIRWLRNLGPMDYELRQSAFQTAAADRIEALVKEREDEKAHALRLEALLREAQSELHCILYENMWTRRMELCRRIDAALKG